MATYSEAKPLSRPWVKGKLCRELAAEELSTNELAAKYSVDRNTIRSFAKRHARRIEEIKQNLDDEFAGQWIARKTARLDVYQNQVLRIERMLDGAEDMKPADITRLLRTQQTALRSVAEELGQLKQELEALGSVRFTIDGVDLDKLR